MALKIPPPIANWNPAYQTRVNQALEANDLTNRKKGTDVEVLKAKLIMTSPNGTRYNVSVSDAGVLSVTPMPP